MDPLADDVRRELRRFGPNAEIGAAVDAWPAAVGEEIARNAWPARFQRDGTLIVHTRDSIWAFELTQRAGEIAKRLPNRPALTFIPGHLPERVPGPTQATPRGSPPPSPEQIALAAQWTAEIEDDDLRKVIARAAEISLARAAADHSF